MALADTVRLVVLLPVVRVPIVQQAHTAAPLVLLHASSVILASTTAVSELLIAQIIAPQADIAKLKVQHPLWSAGVVLRANSVPA